jgi:fatty acid desaturase
MHYIATNHNISPLTRMNDPLANSLTVTNHPVLERLHFHFGYHVEHHVFPTMSGKYLKRAHAVLKRDFPETYQHMPVWSAIRKLYASPRVYKNATTLVHPETGNRVSIQSLLPAMLDLAEETEVTTEKKSAVSLIANGPNTIEATV